MIRRLLAALLTFLWLFSYPVWAAPRFWVGGTGTWDASDTTHWSATSGGASGASVPGSSDTVTFDGSSGGGIVTLNFGGPITVQSITLGAFTGTFDNSVNNNDITLTLTGGSAFNGSGSGARIVKLGTATYTLTGSQTFWNFTTTTNLTYTGNTGASIVFTGATNNREFRSGNLSHGHVTFGASSGAGYYEITGSSPTFASLTIEGPNTVLLPFGATITITDPFAWTGTAEGPVFLYPNAPSTQVNIAAAGGSTATYAAFRGMAFTGSPTATNSFDLGNNSGITIEPPTGGGGGRIIGGN